MSHYSCLSWVPPVVGRGSKVSCPRTLPQNTHTHTHRDTHTHTQRIQCGSNSGRPDYESNTLPLSQAGPLPRTPYPNKSYKHVCELTWSLLYGYDLFDVNLYDIIYIRFTHSTFSFNNRMNPWVC